MTGAATYVDDMQFGPNLLHGMLKRSPIPHGIIKRIDVSKARALPGVRVVVTGQDFPGYTGLYLKDRRIFALDRVRYVGEAVAAVAADTPEIAQQAVELIEVAYEPLPGVFDPEFGASPEAPLVHPDLANYESVPFIFPQPGTNISNWFKVRKGDMDQGWAEADLIYEHKYHVPHIQHVPLETHICVAQQDVNGKITLWSSSQSPFAQRNLIAKALHISHSKLRVITPYVGGGFGCKAGVSMEGRGRRVGNERQGAAGQAAHDTRGRVLHDLCAPGARRLHQDGHDPGRPHHRHAEPLLLGWRRQHRIRDEHHPRGRLQRHRPLLRAQHPRGQLCVYTNHPVGGADARVRHAGDPLGHRAAHRSDGPRVGFGPRAGAAVELSQGGRRDADRNDHAPHRSEPVHRKGGGGDRVGIICGGGATARDCPCGRGRGGLAPAHAGQPPTNAAARGWRRCGKRRPCRPTPAPARPSA